MTTEQLKDTVSFAAIDMALNMSCWEPSVAPDGTILIVAVLALPVVLVNKICLTIVVVDDGTVYSVAVLVPSCAGPPSRFWAIAI
jgi:hypothetical protein